MHLFAPHSIYFRTLSLKMGKKRAEPNPNTHSPKPEQQQLKLMLTAALADAIGENEILRNRICMLEAVLVAMQMRQERQEKRKKRAERQLARARAVRAECGKYGE